MKLIVIGRDPRQAEIVIPNEYVSNYHAEIIQLDNGDTLIVDKSTNGTFVNGEKLIPGKETRIRRGDKVTFAGLDLSLDWMLIPPVKIPEGVRQVRSIGSHYMNTMIVNGPGVSRFHATIREMNDGKWYICDHSKNGTTVNGKSIPKNKYVRIKHGDEISCGGIPVENPARGGGKAWAYVGIALAAACALILVFFGIRSFNRTMSDQELIAKYDNSVVLIMCEYHFIAKSSDVFPESLYEEFVIDDFGNIVEYDGENSTACTATGFFAGEEGTIVTARHVARPWEMNSDTDLDKTLLDDAERIYKKELNELSFGLPQLMETEIEGVIDNIVIVPNGKYFISQSSVNCAEVACSPQEQDLALLKILSDHLPLGVTPVPLDKISVDKPEKGEHVLTIGFPRGYALFDDPEKTEIQANATAGSVTRTDGRFNFGLDAGISSGSSGSPIFDEYGDVIGVLNARHLGMNQAYAIRSEYLSALLYEAGITK